MLLGLGGETGELTFGELAQPMSKAMSVMLITLYRGNNVIFFTYSDKTASLNYFL